MIYKKSKLTQFLEIHLKSSTKYIYFDLGGVVFHFSGGLEVLADKLHAPFERVYKFWQRKDDDICRGKLSPQKFYEQIKNYFNYSGSDIDSFTKFWVDHFQINTPVHDLMKKLANQSVSIGILTSIYPNVFNLALKKGYIPNLDYQSVIQSCDIGLVKPEKGIFKHARRQCNCQSREIILIDDNSKNITQAEKLGWKGFFYDSAGR